MISKTIAYNGDFRGSSDAPKIADSDCELAQVLIDTWAELAVNPFPKFTDVVTTESYF